MKHLGPIKITLLKEGDYGGLFPPLTAPEYTDLRESVKNTGVVKNLVVEKARDGYVIVSGHALKAIAEELGMKKVPCSLAETYEEIAEALVDKSRLVKAARRHGPLNAVYDEDGLYRAARFAIFTALKQYRAAGGMPMSCSAYLSWSLWDVLMHARVDAALKRLRAARREARKAGTTREVI